MINRDALYIDGQWIKPATGEVIEVDEAATEEIIGTVPAGDGADAERAILAARRAFDDWSETPINERADVVQALADGLRANEAKLAKAASGVSIKPPTVWGTAPASATQPIGASAQKERERQAALHAIQQHQQAQPQKPQHGMSLLEIQQQEEEALRAQRSSANASLQQSNAQRNTRTMAQIVSGGPGVVSGASIPVVGGGAKAWGGGGGVAKKNASGVAVPTSDSDFWNAVEPS
jgi:hypothetical protein